MKDESPFAAVHRILKNRFGINDPSNVDTMELIDAVRDTSPPHPNFTIAALRAILRDLVPDNGLHNWASRSADQLVEIISAHPAVQQAAELISDERLWCSLEGTLTGMLMRVTRGQDLVDPPQEIEGYTKRELLLMKERDEALARLKDLSETYKVST